MQRSRSRRISFIAIRFSDSRRMSANTAWPGRGMSSTERAIGPAAASSWRSTGKTLSIHQRATSGNDSSRSVSPVGAQSTTITCQSPDCHWACSRSSENSSSIPGGTVSSAAEMRSMPRSASSSPSHCLTADQWRSSSSWAETWSPQSRSETAVGSEPMALPSESERLCAGSVESTSVRRPAAAHARAVHAATDVLPTPPLPVYRIVRGPIGGEFKRIGLAQGALVPC